MSRKTLNQKNLTALGAERLAGLCLELAQGSAEAKRHLRLALVEAAGPEAMAQEVRKRLTTIGRSKGRVGWRKARSLQKDLEVQRAAIVDRIAPAAPETAFDLLWELVTLAPGLIERVDDEDGWIVSFFDDARDDFAEIAPRVTLEQEALAGRIFEAVRDDVYGTWLGVIRLAGGALKAEGIAALKARIDAYVVEPVDEEEARQLRTTHLGGGRRGYALAPNYAQERKARRVADWRKDVADLEGDVDAFLANLTATQRESPGLAAEAAARLVAAGRAEEALPLLEATERRARALTPVPETWAEAHVAALLALGRTEAAQALRWSLFSAGLDPRWLRDVIAALPDFEDMEAEERGKALAFRHDNFEAALGFFLAWPDRKRAADLVIERHGDLDGDAYWALTPAADALGLEYPLASVLCRRAMIRFALEKGRTSRYRHAARHLKRCAEADLEIESYGRFPDHAAFEKTLRARHGRRYKFWAGVETG